MIFQNAALPIVCSNLKNQQIRSKKFDTKMSLKIFLLIITFTYVDYISPGNKLKNEENAIFFLERLG